MKVIILAGGLGSRLEEITKLIPKPMVLIKSKPIILYVMRTFIKFGHYDFIIALGYKGEKILEYFSKKKITTSIKSELKKGLKVELKLFGKNCSIIFLDTGLKTMTGGRIKRLSRIIFLISILLHHHSHLHNHIPTRLLYLFLYLHFYLN